MADCLINLLKEVGKCSWPLVKPHFDYWWCFDGNVQVLREEIGRLERERGNMDQKIEEARLRVESATDDVNKWSKEGTLKLEYAMKILEGCDDIKKWNIIRRYCVGKNTKKTAEGIAKLRNEGNSIRIADPAPPASMVPITHASTLEFQSRKRIEEDIMEYLKDGNVRMIAICGAGGVGKTTMAKRIEDMMREEKLFAEVVTVVVSQKIDMREIQKQIAEILSLSLSEDTLGGRAHKLRTRLNDSTKKLIIFDDVWKSFVLEDIGVPYGGCKIILTSRLKDVGKKMDADKVIEIQVLDKKEAWTLFREKAGDCVDRSDILPIAEDVAAECKGLPIALAIVGKALQNKDINIWKDALLQLSRANPADFPEVLEDVYMPLKLSYDFLESKSEKSLFLLCCLFPEDYNIQIEELALLSFGLDMFEGINNIEEGRNRTYSLLERLTSRFLLMPGRNEYNVKMHDVVRDVAIFIGSKVKEGFLKSLQVPSKDSSINCNWMSVDISISNAKFPIEFDFPNLRLLMILNSTYFEFSQGFYVNDNFFKGMKELTVLVFKNQNFQSLLPSSLKYLKKLRKLHLECCKVRDISVVGELTGLEILRIRDCNEIEELSADFGKLKFLRLLQLLYCKRLEGIAAGVISSLVELEELRIVGCFNKWGAKGNGSEERNVSLSELECLHNLTFLDIEIFDGHHWSRVGNLTNHEKLQTKIDEYPTRMIEKLVICNRDNVQEIFRDDDNRHIIFQELIALKLMELPCLTTLCIGVESIKFPKLKVLWIENLPRLNSFLSIDSEQTHDHHSLQFFCNKKVEIIGLKTLYLQDLPDKISNIWCRHIPISFFHDLESLSIDKVDGIKNLFSSSIAKALVNLKKLDISSCKEAIDAIEDETHMTVTFVLPKLENLYIKSNCKLRSFCQWKHAFELPSLEEVEIVNCPLMKTFTLGLLSTPKLRRFSINYVEIEIKDLNVGIHHFISTETANEDEDEDEIEG